MLLGFFYCFIEVVRSSFFPLFEISSFFGLDSKSKSQSFRQYKLALLNSIEIPIIIIIIDFSPISAEDITCLSFCLVDKRYAR